MGRAKKSTRKFEKNHLKDTLERRKESAKIKQRVKATEKTKKKKSARLQDEENSEQDGDHKSAKNTKPLENGLAKMTVDEFFQGGFDIPELTNGLKKRASEASKKRKREPGQEVAAEYPDSSNEEDVLLEEDEDGLDGSDEGSLDMDMEALAEKDPEFYQFLKENDNELLEFDEHGEVAGQPDAISQEDESPPAKKQKKKVKKEQKAEEDDPQVESAEDGIDNADETTLTLAMVEKWRIAMVEVHSLRAMRQVAIAFRAAAHVSEADGQEYKYTISSPEVYHELLVTALRDIPSVLNHHLPVKESSKGKMIVPTDSKKFKTLTPLLKSHTTAITHLLTTLSDAATLKLTLSSLTSLLPYLLSFKKLIRTLLKTIVEIWSLPSSTEPTRINAFLVIRHLATTGDPSIKEAALKSTYQGLVKGSRNTTVHTLAGVNLMKNSAAELWGLDASIGYTTGFTFIRQLAIHLRTTITHPTQDSYKNIYNWQYVHSLDFWSRVLATHCDGTVEASKGGKESPLRPLIYPTVQITLGALRLIPTPTYFPLRFHLTRSLLRLSRATGTYIPLVPALLEVLNSTEMKKYPKPSTLKPLDFETVIRAPKTYLRTRVYQDGVGEQTVELLGEFFVLWCKSIAFPELALPVTVMLRRWVKDTSSSSTATSKSSKGAPSKNGRKGHPNSRLTSSVQLLIQKLEANARWIEEKREGVEFAPEAREQVESFLKETEWEKSPLGAFVLGARKQREERKRVLEDGRRMEEARAQKGKRNGAVADADEMEVDEEEDEDEAEAEDVDVDDDEDE